MFLTAVFLAPLAVHAEDNKIFVKVTGSTITKGYTVSLGQDAALGIAPNILGQDTLVRLERASTIYPVPAGVKQGSDMWIVDVTSAQPTVPPTPLVIKQPIVVSLLPATTDLYRKRIFFYDRNKKKWFPLISDRDLTTGAVRAMLPMPFAELAVLEDNAAVEGKGSWFRHKLGDTAASNDFPMGSTLKVTDLDTKKSVNVVVRSRGPFVAGRVIDIARTAFKQLHSLSAGIAHLRVELIS